EDDRRNGQYDQRPDGPVARDHVVTAHTLEHEPDSRDEHRHAQDGREITGTHAQCRPERIVAGHPPAYASDKKKEQAGQKVLVAQCRLHASSLCLRYWPSEFTGQPVPAGAPRPLWRTGTSGPSCYVSAC